MRELTKIQLYEMINMMREAMEYRGSLEETMTLLVDCQTAAIKMGEIIERETTPEHSAIRYLEAYVECIYQAGSNPHDTKQCKSYLKQGEKYLKEIENLIHYKIEKTLEVLFLPYKASMWDCFDSIYRAILEEGKHYPVVMPIPYYSLDSQRKAVESKYEGEDLPNDIVITDYRAYDMTERRPDVIFIHNPYDEYNLVTQVSKQFFSSELIKITKYLVYIPYLICSGTQIAEHYVLMPGVVNAWRTYVQSDDIRRSYLEYYPFGDKIVAMGSPKIDMVLRINAQEKIIPGEWKAKLADRKVFLYNTHLHNIMGHAETLFNEYDYVLNEFVGREDVALLWRPHPLSEETVKTFTPWIYTAYMDYLAKAEEQNNVVIDKSADLHRAIALSDAYVGDQSSLVELFGITGKPLFITGEEKFSEKRWGQLELRAFLGFAVDGNNLWVPDIVTRSLFKIDMTTWIATYVARFPMEDLIDYESVTFREIAKMYNKIVVMAGSYLFIYNADVNLMKRIDLCSIVKQELRDIGNMFCYHDEVWLFPAYYGQPLLIYDYRDDSVRVDKRFDKIQVLCGERSNKDLSYGRCICVKNLVWFTLYGSNKVISINMNNDEIISYELSKKPYVMLAYYKDTLWWLNDTRDTLIRYDLTIHGEEHFYFGRNDGDYKGVHGNIIVDEDYVYILPVNADVIIVFNKKQSDFSYINIKSEHLNPYMRRPNQIRHFLSAMPYPGGILLFPLTHRGILRLECKEGEWNSELQLIQTERDGLKRWFWDSKAQICHSNTYPLELFIDRVSQLDNLGIMQDNGVVLCNSEFSRYLKTMDGRCGESIWMDIKKILKNNL